MKFAVVTPCLNAESHIAEAIESVVFQRGDFSIDYVIVDGGSSDRTGEIVQFYEALIQEHPSMVHCRGVSLRWLSEPDDGMYDALNNGFARTSGDVMAWINADDIYLPGAFSAVASVFRDHRDIAWLKGVTSYMNAGSSIDGVGEVNLYCQEWLREGDYGRELHFVQQDSVFWRTALWDRVGGFPPGLRLAGDYWLWSSFAEYEPLYSVRAYTSCFRRNPGQLSEDMAAYRQEMRTIRPGVMPNGRQVLRFFRYEHRLPDWLSRVLYRWIAGRHVYRAVVLNGGAGPRKIESDYVTVRAAV